MDNTPSWQGAVYIEERKRIERLMKLRLRGITDESVHAFYDEQHAMKRPFSLKGLLGTSNGSCS